MSKHAIPGFPKGLFVAQPFIWMFSGRAWRGLVGAAGPALWEWLCWGAGYLYVCSIPLPRALIFQEYFFITRMQMPLLVGDSPASLPPTRKKKCNTNWTLMAVLTAKVFPGSLSNFSSLFPRTAMSNLNCKWQAGDCCAALPELMLCFHVFSFINSSSASLC